MASPAGRLYSAASRNMDDVIQRKGVNSGILSRKPLLDRPVNSKSPSLTGPMHKTGAIGKQSTNKHKLCFPSMTKQFAELNLAVEEEDLDAEEFMFSFEEVEDEYWRDNVDDVVNAAKFLKTHFGNLETPPPSPVCDMKPKEQHIDLDPELENEYVLYASFDLEVSEPEFDLSF